MVKNSHFLVPVCLLAISGIASAYTISGSVTDEKGGALKGVSVSLLKEGKTASTDDQGKFTIHEDEMDTSSTAIDLSFKNAVGYIGVNGGVLSYSQGSTQPVQVKIFNSLGSQVFNK
ncbi:MAG: carboxypeptidase regulatory-like domain-containing protein, partial [Fibrobacteraceae bacterium]|nr:carboxypeptidase regulatory-like domain-containing protein [Fibrobacteraceae bacterium]